MRFSALVGVALAQLASATFITPKPEACKPTEFWYGARSVCIPQGGPPTKPTLPTGVKCPASWSWQGNNGCCLPNHPPPPNPPTPQCPNGWYWSDPIHKCLPIPKPPTPPTPHPPQPSKSYGGHKRRQYESRITLCPAGLVACPLTAGDYDCLDISSELSSCGGCVSQGNGQDCTSIKGAWNVGCTRSSCLVYSCSGGYELSSDRKSCRALY